MSISANTHDRVGQTAPTKSRLPIFILAWLGLLADGYDLFVYGATVPGFIKKAPWNATPASAGLVGSIALVGMLVGSLIVGTLTDRLGRRKLMVAALTLFSLCMLGCAAAPNFTVFAAFRFFACLGVGGLLPTAVAMVNEFAEQSRKSIILGLALTGPATGTLLASVSAMNLLPAHGVRPVYAIGGLSLLLAPVMWKLMPESPAFLRAVGREEESERIATAYGLPIPPKLDHGLAAPAHDPNHPRNAVAGIFSKGYLGATLGMWLMCLISLLTIFGLTTWLPQSFRQAGYGTSAAITFLLYYSIGAIVGTILAAIISQRTSPKLMVLVGFLSAAAALLFVTTKPTGLALILAVVVAGFGGLGTQNMLNDHIAQFYPSTMRATGLGWALAVGRAGAIAGPSYGAAMVGATGGFTQVALAFGVPAILGAVVSLFLPRFGPDQKALLAKQGVLR